MGTSSGGLGLEAHQVLGRREGTVLKCGLALADEVSEILKNCCKFPYGPSLSHSQRLCGRHQKENRPEVQLQEGFSVRTAAVQPDVLHQ